MYISAASVISDNGPGRIEVAIAPYEEGYNHGLYICSLGETNATVTMVDPMNLYSSVSTIQNVPGENYSEVIAAEEDGPINCFSADIQTIPEFSVVIYFAIMPLASLFVIVVKRIFKNKTRP
jgi:hypothetical protein